MTDLVTPKALDNVAFPREIAGFDSSRSRKTSGVLPSMSEFLRIRLPNASQPCLQGLYIWLVVWMFIPSFVFAHESPIDHVDRTLRMRVEGSRLLLTYRLRLTQRAALLQLRAMDEDKNGRVNDDERERFFDKFANELAKQLRVELDGKVLLFQPRGRVQLNPDFSQTIVFVAEIGELAKGKHGGLLKDFHSRSYPGSFVFLQQRAPENERAIVEAHSQPVGGGHTGMLSIRFDVRVK